MTKVLHLTLKKKWFDMIISGEKTEEYREIKPYWIKRLTEGLNETKNIVFKKFDIIRFKHGYAKDAPQFDIELLGIDTYNPRPEWSEGSNKVCFVLKLGEIKSP